jgi:hypothetical protein
MASMQRWLEADRECLRGFQKLKAWEMAAPIKKQVPEDYFATVAQQWTVPHPVNYPNVQG